MTFRLALVLAVVALPGLALAQERPDLSGAWVLESPATQGGVPGYVHLDGR